MKLLLVLGFLSATLFSTAQARIGDNEAELINRFGKPVSRDTTPIIPTVSFTFDDWLVTCDLVDGVCVRITYAKTGEWSEEIFEKLLSANGPRAGWTDLATPSMKKLTRKWKHADGTVASWMVGCLSVTSPRYEKARAMTEKEALMAATSS